MKTIFISVTILLIFFNFGLSQQWYIGVNNGLDFNLYKFYNSDYKSGRSIVKPDIGWTFGLSGLYRPNHNISLQGGISITTKQLIPDINKIIYIFESVHYTNLEIPLKLKYRVYSFGKRSMEDIIVKGNSNKKRANKKAKIQFDPSAIQLSLFAGLNYTQMLKAKPKYFDDSNIVYPPLELLKLIYPELGLSFSKSYNDIHIFSIDFLTRISRRPYEFSTEIVEKLSLEFNYFYRM